MLDIFQMLGGDLVIVSVVLYFLGIWLKQAQFPKDKYIPLILLGIGIIVTTVYCFATADLNGYQDILMTLYTGVTKGALAAFASTFVNQIIKQLNKNE